jgi:hypothetical protein
VRMSSSSNPGKFIVPGSDVQLVLKFAFLDTIPSGPTLNPTF